MDLDQQSALQISSAKMTQNKRPPVTKIWDLLVKGVQYTLNEPKETYMQFST